ncbi:Protein YIP4 [Erysiphe neolycopersici]|uniref:Protein YIP n=1 Tax=Erysiphe neolycopersici TaxID=212602 RepID=A0A420HHW2_9PEZI|nr:Protein YIP4 [Erysiphe neolycopersici]
MTSSNNYQHTKLTQDEDDLIDPDNASLDDLDDPIQPTSSRAPLSGNITQPSDRTNAYLTSRIPGEDRRAAQDTIDESVWDTLSRDLRAIWSKMREVLYPKYLFGGSMPTSLRGTYDTLRATNREELLGLAGRVVDTEALLEGSMSDGLRDWDLWGPLVFCLLLSLFLSFTAASEQKSLVFSGVFAMVWIGEAVVTAQIKLLGGNISFAQSICIIGYTLFPIVIASLLSVFHLPIVARIPIYLILIAWSLAAGVSILGGSGVVKNRVGIAVYPLFVFYLGLGCLCFIS